MSVDIKIRRLLETDPFLNAIHFSMPGAPTIRPRDYRALASCFSKRPVRRRIRVATRSVHILSGFGAQYVSANMPLQRRQTDGTLRTVTTLRGDTVYLSAPNILDTSHGRALVVHELTHALIDAMMIEVSFRDDEAVAYLAMLLYFHAAGGGSWYGRPEPDESRGRARNRQALEAMRTVALGVGARAGAGPTEVTQDERLALRQAIGTYGYPLGSSSFCNGIGGWRLQDGTWIRAGR